MSIEKRIKVIVADQLGLTEEEVKPESRFVEDLGADSLDQVELIMAMEEEFQTEIPDGDLDGLKSVKDIVEYVQAHQ